MWPWAWFSIIPLWRVECIHRSVKCKADHWVSLIPTYMYKGTHFHNINVNSRIKLIWEQTSNIGKTKSHVSLRVHLHEVYKMVEIAIRQCSPVNTNILTTKPRKWFRWDVILIVCSENCLTDLYLCWYRPKLNHILHELNCETY